MKAGKLWLWMLLLGSIALPSQNPGAVFLMIWPAARPTALGGAFTSIADDASCLYYNQGGLAFLEGTNATLMHCNWLPGLWQGMYYEYLGISHSFGDRGSVGLNAIYLTTGETDVINERGEFLGRYTTFDVAPSVGYGFPVMSNLGVGFGVKLVYSFLVPEWVWDAMPELGIEAGGTGISWAVDAGVLYKPWWFMNAGLSLANFGPDISYTSTGEADPLPRMLRAGVTLFPVKSRMVRVSVTPEVSKILVGMFYNPSGNKSFGRMLQEELRDAWKSIGIEAGVADILFARVGYFEDLTGARGGLVYERDEQTNHYGIWDALTRRNLGKFRSLGLCFGVGIQIRRFQFDVGVDQMIYDFPTQNYKFSFSYRF